MTTLTAPGILVKHLTASNILMCPEHQISISPNLFLLFLPEVLLLSTHALKTKNKAFKQALKSQRNCTNQRAFETFSIPPPKSVATETLCCFKSPCCRKWSCIFNICNYFLLLSQIHFFVKLKYLSFQVHSFSNIAGLLTASIVGTPLLLSILWHPP